MTLAHDVTLLIPTLNRAEFVERLLQYYRRVGFSGVVSLGDSSQPEPREKIQQALRAVEKDLRVEYRYFPSPPYSSNAPVIREMVEAAATPYVAYAGDDDFLVPRTLELCARFLDDHPGYSAAHGLSVVIVLGRDGPYGPIAHAYYMEGHILDADRAAERWAGYARHALSTQYYVHRREAWRRMYRDVGLVPIQYWGTEFLPCSLSAISGRIHEIDELGCVFQVNNVRSFGWTTHSMYLLSLDPGWSSALPALRSILTQAIAEADRVPLEQARNTVDKELWRHLMIMLQAHYDEHYAEPGNPFSAFKKRFPRLVQLMRLLRQVRRGHYRRISLPLLLQARHPLHADFLPVYEIVTGGAAA